MDNTHKSLSGVGNSLLDKLDQLGNKMADLAKYQEIKSKIDVEGAETAIKQMQDMEKASANTDNSIKGLYDTITKLNKRQGKTKYYKSEAANLAELTAQYEAYRREVVETEKKKLGGGVLRWRNAYIGHGYDMSKIPAAITNDESIKKLNDAYNQNGSYKSWQPETFKALFDVMNQYEAMGGNLAADFKVEFEKVITKSVAEAMSSGVKKGVEEGAKKAEAEVGKETKPIITDEWIEKALNSEKINKKLADVNRRIKSAIDNTEGWIDNKTGSKLIQDLSEVEAILERLGRKQEIMSFVKPNMQSLRNMTLAPDSYNKGIEKDEDKIALSDSKVQESFDKLIENGRKAAERNIKSIARELRKANESITEEQKKGAQGTGIGETVEKEGKKAEEGAKKIEEAGEKIAATKEKVAEAPKVTADDTLSKQAEQMTAAADTMEKAAEKVSDSKQKMASAMSGSATEIFNPIAVYLQEGLESLVSKVESLTVEQMKQIIKEFGLNRNIKNYNKISDHDKLADALYKATTTRATKGDAYASFEKDVQTLTATQALEKINELAEASRRLRDGLEQPVSSGGLGDKVKEEAEKVSEAADKMTEAKKKMGETVGTEQKQTEAPVQTAEQIQKRIETTRANLEKAKAELDELIKQRDELIAKIKSGQMQIIDPATVAKGAFSGYEGAPTDTTIFGKNVEDAIANAYKWFDSGINSGEERVKNLQGLISQLEQSLAEMGAIGAEKTGSAEREEFLNKQSVASSTPIVQQSESVVQAINEVTNAETQVSEAAKTAGETGAGAMEKIADEAGKTTEQVEKMGVAIRDALAFRGTNGADVITANKSGATFWSNVKENAKQYGTDGDDKTLYSAFLSMKNALEIDANGSKWGEITYLGNGADDTSKKILELSQKAQECKDELNRLAAAGANDTDSMQRATTVALEYSQVLKDIKAISDDLSNPYGTHSTDWFADYAKRNGYDGVHFKNVIDTPNAYVKDQAPSDVYATFYREQLKDVQLLEQAGRDLSSSLVGDSDIVARAKSDIETLKGEIESFKAKMSEADPDGIINKVIFGADGNLRDSEVLINEIKTRVQTLITELSKSSPHDISETMIKNALDNAGVFKSIKAVEEFGLAKATDIFGTIAYKDRINSAYNSWNKSSESSSAISDAVWAYDNLVNSQQKLNELQRNGGQEYVDYLMRAKEVAAEFQAIKTRNANTDAVDVSNMSLTKESAAAQIETLSQEKSAIDVLITSLRALDAEENQAFAESSGIGFIQSKIEAMEMLRSVIEDNINSYANFEAIQKEGQKILQIDMFSEAIEPKLTKGSADRELLTDIKTEYQNVIDAISDGRIATAEQAIESFNAKMQELGVTFNETEKRWEEISAAKPKIDVQSVVDQYKRSDDEIYESAMELASKRESIFKEIAKQEKELAMTYQKGTTPYNSLMQMAQHAIDIDGMKNGSKQQMAEIESLMKWSNKLINGTTKSMLGATNEDNIRGMLDLIESMKIKLLALQEVYSNLKVDYDSSKPFSKASLEPGTVEFYENNLKTLQAIEKALSGEKDTSGIDQQAAAMENLKEKSTEAKTAVEETKKASSEVQSGGAGTGEQTFDSTKLTEYFNKIMELGAEFEKLRVEKEAALSSAKTEDAIHVADEYNQKIIAIKEQINGLLEPIVKVAGDFGLASAIEQFKQLQLEMDKVIKQTSLQPQSQPDTAASQSRTEAYKQEKQAIFEVTSEMNKYRELLEKSFATPGKKAAADQLRDTYKEYQKYFGENGVDADKIVRDMSDAGRMAGYSYAQALQEAIKQQISTTNLNKYLAGSLGKGDLAENVGLLLNQFKPFMEEQARVLEELGNPKLSEDGIKSLTAYMEQWDLIQNRMSANKAFYQDDNGIINSEMVQADLDLLQMLKDKLVEVSQVKPQSTPVDTSGIEQAVQSQQTLAETTAQTNAELEKQTQVTPQPNTSAVESQAEAYRVEGQAAAEATAETEKLNETRQTATSSPATQAIQDISQPIKDEISALEGMKPVLEAVSGLIDSFVQKNDALNTSVAQSPGILNQLADALRNVAGSITQVNDSMGAGNLGNIGALVSAQTQPQTVQQPAVDVNTIQQIDAMIQAEIDKLNELKKKLETEITQAIQTKNEKFEEEAIVVGNAVQQECEKFAPLITLLTKTIPDAINAKDNKFTSGVIGLDAKSFDDLGRALGGFKSVLGDISKALDGVGKNAAFTEMLNNIKTAEDALKNFAEILSKTKQEQDAAMNNAKKSTYDKTAAEQQAEAIRKATADAEENIEKNLGDNGYISRVRKFFDSHGVLVETIIEVKKRILDAAGNLKQIETELYNTKFNKGGDEKYTSKMLSTDFEAAVKERERTNNEIIRITQEFEKQLTEVTNTTRAAYENYDKIFADEATYKPKQGTQAERFAEDTKAIEKLVKAQSELTKLEADKISAGKINGNAMAEAINNVTKASEDAKAAIRDLADLLKKDVISSDLYDSARQIVATNLASDTSPRWLLGDVKSQDAYLNQVSKVYDTLATKMATGVQMSEREVSSWNSVLAVINEVNAAQANEQNLTAGELELLKQVETTRANIQSIAQHMVETESLKAADAMNKQQIKDYDALLKEYRALSTKKIKDSILSSEVENWKLIRSIIDEINKKKQDGVRLNEQTLHFLEETARIDKDMQQIESELAAKKAESDLSRSQQAAKAQISDYARNMREYEKLYLKGALKSPSDPSKGLMSSEAERMRTLLDYITKAEQNYNAELLEGVRLTQKQVEAREQLAKGQDNHKAIQDALARGETPPPALTQTMMNESAIQQAAYKLYNDAAKKIDTFGRQTEWRADGWEAKVDEWKSKLETDFDPSIVKTTEQLDAMRKQMTAFGTDMDGVSKGFSFKPLRDDEVANLDNKIVMWMEKNKAAAREFSTELEELRTRLQQVTNPGQIQTISKEFSQIQTKSIEKGLMGPTFKDIFSDQGKRALASMATYYMSFHAMIRYMRRAISTVKEMDTAMTELKKVTDASTAAYNNFRQASFDIAAATGSTAKNIVTAATEWARLGYSLTEAGELAKASAIYSTVGGVEAKQATTDLVSVLKAFKMDASEAMSIVDVLAETGNNYAISASELGEVLKKSSAALAVSGDSFEQIAAMGAAMNAVIQDASVTGSTLKSIALRLRGTKVQVEEAGEDTAGMATSKSKLRSQIMALTNVNGSGGVDIMLDSETYKTTYDILKEIAAVWKDINGIQKSALLELISGIGLPQKYSNIFLSTHLNALIA